MFIYIPTFGRPEKQITFKALPQCFQKKVVFVVRDEEYKAVQRLFGGKCKEIIVQEGTGVAAGRQTAVEHSPHDAICFLDDDIRFSTRLPDWDYTTNNRALKSSVQDVQAGIEWIEEQLNEYDCVGLGARGGNNGIPKRWVNLNYRIMRSFGVSKSALRRYNLRFDDFYYWEDFHVAMSLLELGRENIVSVNWVTDGVTNAKGGVVRNLKKMWIQARKFVDLHPSAVLVEKKFKHGDKELADTIFPDLRIAWKKTLGTKA